MIEEFDSYLARRVKNYKDLLRAQIKAFQGELRGNVFSGSVMPEYGTVGGINNDHIKSVGNLIELHKRGILTENGQGNQWDPHKGNYQRSYLDFFCPWSIGGPLLYSLEKDPRIYVRLEDIHGKIYDNFKYDYKYKYKKGQRGFILTIDHDEPFSIRPERPIMADLINGLDDKAEKIMNGVRDLRHIQISVRNFGMKESADKIVLEHLKALDGARKEKSKTKWWKW